jgi:hypothetical protein
VTDRFPVAFSVLRTWAAEHGVPVPEARIRFAQYAILYAIAGSRALGAVLVFKGGNALDFVWQPNRSTIDLDFSADLAPDDEPLTPDRLKALLGRALADVGRRLGLAFAIHRVEQQPPGPNRTFITYTARIGYALPDDTTPRARLGRPSGPREPARTRCRPISPHSEVGRAGGSEGGEGPAQPGSSEAAGAVWERPGWTGVACRSRDGRDRNRTRCGDIMPRCRDGRAGRYAAAWSSVPPCSCNAPLATRSAKAATTRGSNWVPLFFSNSASATSQERAAR